MRPKRLRIYNALTGEYLWSVYYDELNKRAWHKAIELSFEAACDGAEYRSLYIMKDCRPIAWMSTTVDGCCIWADLYINGTHSRRMTIAC